MLDQSAHAFTFSLSANHNNNNNNNNLMLISRKFTFIYDQMRVTTVEIKITLYE
jgi:hypothetical protein